MVWRRKICGSMWVDGEVSVEEVWEEKGTVIRLVFTGDVECGDLWEDQVGPGR